MRRARAVTTPSKTQHRVDRSEARRGCARRSATQLNTGACGSVAHTINELAVREKLSRLLVQELTDPAETRTFRQ